MNTTGSYNGNLALTTLAADLGLTATALKTALEDAHDLLQLYRNPKLALHMALARLGYQIDGQVIYAKLSTFRELFSGTLNGATVAPLTSQPATSQMRPNPYRTMGNVPSNRAVLPVQYTPNAMPWRSGQHDTPMMSPPQLTPSPYNSDGIYYRPQISTQQQSVRSPHHPHGSFAQPLPHDHYNPDQEQTTWYQKQTGENWQGYDNSGSELLHRVGGMN